MSNFKTFIIAIAGTSFSDFLHLIIIIILFIVTLFGAYYVTKFLGNFQKNRTKNSNISIIEVIAVGPGKTLQLIKVCNEYILIGVTKENIIFLEKVDGETVKNIDDIDDSNTFKEYFRKYLNKSNK